VFAVCHFVNKVRKERKRPSLADFFSENVREGFIVTLKMRFSCTFYLIFMYSPIAIFVFACYNNYALMYIT